MRGLTLDQAGAKLRSVEGRWLTGGDMKPDFRLSTADDCAAAIAHLDSAHPNRNGVKESFIQQLAGSIERTILKIRPEDMGRLGKAMGDVATGKVAWREAGVVRQRVLYGPKTRLICALALFSTVRTILMNLLRMKATNLVVAEHLTKCIKELIAQVGQEGFEAVGEEMSRIMADKAKKGIFAVRMSKAALDIVSKMMDTLVCLQKMDDRATALTKDDRVHGELDEATKARIAQAEAELSIAV